MWRRGIVTEAVVDPSDREGWWGDGWMLVFLLRSHPARETFVFYLFGRVNILYTTREEGFYYKFLWKKGAGGGLSEIKKCGNGKNAACALGRGGAPPNDWGAWPRNDERARGVVN